MGLSTNSRVDESLNSSLSGFRSARKRKKKKINLNSSRKTASCYSVSQQNQAVYSYVSLSILKTLFSGQQLSLIPTNQTQALFSSPSLFFSPWDSAAGSHSSGMNLPRLEYSAKGHYPGLHVCWAAVLSNSTRCRCDHWVTCEGKGSSCTSSLSYLLSNLFPSEILSANWLKKLVSFLRRAQPL